MLDNDRRPDCCHRPDGHRRGTLREKLFGSPYPEEKSKFIQLAQTKAKADEEQQKQEVAAFQASLDNAGVDSSLVYSFTVQGDELTIVVTAVCHQLDYQTRLQGAQNFENVWKSIHGENALLRITDLNGNEVGGTSLVSGVWAQKED